MVWRMVAGWFDRVAALYVMALQSGLAWPGLAWAQGDPALHGCCRFDTITARGLASAYIQPTIQKSEE
jgi:hypothetical protein